MHVNIHMQRYICEQRNLSTFSSLCSYSILQFVRVLMNLKVCIWYQVGPGMIFFQSLPVDPSSSLKNPYLCSQMERSKTAMVNQCQYLLSTDPLVIGVSKSISTQRGGHFILFNIPEMVFQGDRWSA